MEILEYIRGRRDCPVPLLKHVRTEIAKRDEREKEMPSYAHKFVLQNCSKLRCEQMGCSPMGANAEAAGRRGAYN